MLRESVLDHLLVQDQRRGHNGISRHAGLISDLVHTTKSPGMILELHIQSHVALSLASCVHTKIYVDRRAVQAWLPNTANNHL